MFALFCYFFFSTSQAVLFKKISLYFDVELLLQPTHSIEQLSLSLSGLLPASSKVIALMPSSCLQILFYRNLALHGSGYPAFPTRGKCHRGVGQHFNLCSLADSSKAILSTRTAPSIAENSRPIRGFCIFWGS